MQPTMMGGATVAVVVTMEVGTYLTHMFLTQMALYGYRPAQSESFMQPTMIGGATEEKAEEDGGGGTTQMLRLLQIWPKGQSEFFMQPTLMGGATEEDGAGAGGAATQMLWLQT
jgi:hypothetical protein